MNVLVAGGAGYIGSHTVKRLKEAGHSPVDLRQSLPRAPGSDRHPEGPGHRRGFERPAQSSSTLSTRHKIDTVIHFAAYAYVGESVDQPLMYYQNNVATTVSVLQAMKEVRVKRFVFSSTCATYGNPEKVPITEDEKKAPVSPYGRSKLMVEQILADYAVADPQFKFAALRYFNASGCAMDGSIGEDHDPETHLIPVVLQAILGVRPRITVFGTDYPTPDGTNIRDYIHVDDLADAHILAMEGR